MGDTADPSPSVAPDPSDRVIDALRDFDAADHAMRRRTRDAMSMGETDLRALRFLLAARRTSSLVTPRDLALHLGLAASSVTTVIDRLTVAGHARRIAHPTDRRSLAVEATEHADASVRTTLRGMHERMLGVADTLDDDDASTVRGFLERMSDAADSIDGESPSRI